MGSRKEAESKDPSLTISRAGYYAYIRSPAWKAVRLRYLRSQLPKDCFVCRARWRNDFTFHHRSYKNLGHERLLDIVPVCWPCHQGIHASGQPIWAATTKARRRHARKLRKKRRTYPADTLTTTRPPTP